MSRETITSITFFLIIGFIVVLQIFFNTNPISVGRYVVAQIGSSIGITVSVPVNPFNTLAQQLDEKEALLLEKEKKLQQREMGLQESLEEKGSGRNRSLIYGVVGGVLLILILMNFYFDHRRRSRI